MSSGPRGPFYAGQYCGAMTDPTSSVSPAIVVLVVVVLLLIWWLVVVKHDTPAKSHFCGGCGGGLDQGPPLTPGGIAVPRCTCAAASPPSLNAMCAARPPSHTSDDPDMFATPTNALLLGGSEPAAPSCCWAPPADICDAVPVGDPDDLAGPIGLDPEELGDGAIPEEWAVDTAPIDWHRIDNEDYLGPDGPRPFNAKGLKPLTEPDHTPFST